MPEVKRAALSKELIMSTEGDHWSGADAIEITLLPTPVLMQPSEYIQNTVQQGDVGAIKSVDVRAVHDDASLYLRLEWADPDRSDDVSQPNLFPDGIAVMFPFGDDAPLITMGVEGFPVNQWHWQAGLERPHNVTTAGLGTSYRTPESFIEAKDDWQNGRWVVVLTRPLETSDPDNHVGFQIGQPFKAAFCVWEGGNKERAGVKSYSVQWTEYSWEA